AVVDGEAVAAIAAVPAAGPVFHDGAHLGPADQAHDVAVAAGEYLRVGATRVEGGRLDEGGDGPGGRPRDVGVEAVVGLQPLEAGGGEQRRARVVVDVVGVAGR